MRWHSIASSNACSVVDSVIGEVMMELEGRVRVVDCACWNARVNAASDQAVGRAASRRRH